jgi:hypothetical protein
MQMLCCWERAGPIHECFCRVDGLVAWAVAPPPVSLWPLVCRCFAAASVSAPSADALTRRWSSYLGGGCRQCLGALPCRCFAAASVSAPSADALPRDGLRVWADALPPGF